MTAQKLDDRQIIPMMNERTLALRWRNLAEKEGHTAKAPTLETQKRQKRWKQADKMKAMGEHNARLKDAANAAVLAAMGDKEWTAKELASAIGVVVPTARHRLRRLHADGLVEVVREDNQGCYSERTWRARIETRQHQMARPHAGRGKAPVRRMAARAGVYAVARHGRHLDREGLDMIDIKPSIVNWTDYLEDTYRDTSANVTNVTLHDVPPVRQSNVLGPDGNPVCVDVPRPKIGFDLRPKAKP